MASTSAPAVEEEFSLDNAQIVVVVDGAVTRVASGKLSILAAITSNERMLFLLCDSFSYPLVEQPVMKSDDRLYLLPAPSDSASSTSSSSSSSSSTGAGGGVGVAGGRTYVLTFDAATPQEDVRTFERYLAESTNFRTRETQALVIDRTTAGAGALPPPPSPPPLATTTTTTPHVSSTGSIITAAATSVTSVSRNPSSSTPVAPSATLPTATTSATAIVQHPTAASSNNNGTVSSYLPSSISNLTVGEVGNGISTGVMLAGKVTAAALVVGADFAGKGMKWAADKAVTVLGKSEQPVKFTPETQTRLDQAKMVSRAAVVVSAAVVMGAATMAKSLGAAVSSAFLSTEYGKTMQDQSHSEAGKAVRHVAASSLVAFGDVWDGLEQAAKIFGSHTAEATTHFVGERYGDDAAVVAGKSLAVAADVGMTALNMRNVSVGGLIRRTGVATAKELVGCPDGSALHSGENHNSTLRLGNGAGQLALTNGNTTNNNSAASSLLPMLAVAAAASSVLTPAVAATTSSSSSSSSSNGNNNGTSSIAETMAALSIMANASHGTLPTPASNPAPRG